MRCSRGCLGGRCWPAFADLLATTVAVADDVQRKGLTLNMPASKPVGLDQVLYYIGQHRIAE